MFSTFKAIRSPTLSHAKHVRQGSRVAWWQVPTLLSLDAPVVALVWQLLVARATPSSFSWQAPVLLFASVWLVYVIDRCLDARKLTLRSAVTPRHRFYVRHARGFWCLAAGVLIFCVGVSVTLEPRLLAIGISIALVSGLYLALVHRGNIPQYFPKEVQIAVVFSLGVHVALSPWGVHQLLSGMLFALLCFLNCAFIAFWERDADTQQDQRSLARSHPRLRPLLHGLALLLAAMSGLSLWLLPEMLSVWACLALSSGLLWWLEQRHQQLPTPVLRVLADAVLLTPCLFLFW